MIRTLQFKMLICFLFISFSGVILVNFCIPMGFQDVFENYLQVDRERNIRSMEDEIKIEYKKVINSLILIFKNFYKIMQ